MNNHGTPHIPCLEKHNASEKTDDKGLCETHQTEVKQCEQHRRQEHNRTIAPMARQTALNHRPEEKFLAQWRHEHQQDKRYARRHINAGSIDPDQCLSSDNSLINGDGCSAAADDCGQRELPCTRNPEQLPTHRLAMHK